MMLAVCAGVCIAAGRVYGAAARPRRCSRSTSKSIRGTPVLLQLFVIYYGLSGVVRLPAFAAAVLGLGLNYAAYESEIYRSRARGDRRARSSRPRERSGSANFRFFGSCAGRRRYDSRSRR